MFKKKETTTKSKIENSMLVLTDKDDNCPICMQLSHRQWLKWKSNIAQIAKVIFKYTPITCCRLDRHHVCCVSIEFSFYLNFNLLLKIDATCSIDRIIKFGCNLIARKIWLPPRYFNPRTFRSRTEQNIHKSLFNFEFLRLPKHSTTARQ